jgi:selenophosphate synthetase-related protein
MYPGMGFVLTAKEEHCEEVCRRFSRVGMTAHSIGMVDTSRELRITYREEETSVFDFSKNGIMGLFTGPDPCP